MSLLEKIECGLYGGAVAVFATGDLAASIALFGIAAVLTAQGVLIDGERGR